MSRLLLVGTLLAALTSSAVARSFAQAPPASSNAPAQIEKTSTVNRAAVGAKLAKQRASNLQRFRAYRTKGSFPSNTYLNQRLNVWIDADGRLCAAATIISASGMNTLVLQTAQDNNFIRLGDVRDGALMNWILTSGLTQDEIAAIQEPFDPVYDEPMRGEPAPLAVAPAARAAEDQRLAARYKQVEQQIVRAQRASLDVATDRLMAKPDLAAAFLRG
ncbi:MAG: hypothetical protein ACKV2T_32530 [Kofleriaceae bacterium]